MKYALFTGAGGGLGGACSKALAAAGWAVFAADIDKAALDEIGKTPRIVPLIMDVTDADAVQRASEKVGSLLGSNRLAGLVNNAGVVVSGPLLHLRPSELRRQLEANVIGPLMVTQAFAPLLGTDSRRPDGPNRKHQLHGGKGSTAFPGCLRHLEVGT